jgi:hypothetical protein
MEYLARLVFAGSPWVSSLVDLAAFVADKEVFGRGRDRDIGTTAV